MPGRAAERISTASGGSARVFSCITTASQPSGTGAPVMMRAQVPGVSATVGRRPATTVSTMRSRTGTCVTSAARTA